MNISAERRQKIIHRAIKVGLFVAVGLVFAGGISRVYQFWDDDPDRGALAMPEPDHWGEHFDHVVYLPDQGWSAADSLWFYTTTQGSDLMPYDFFLALEQMDTAKPFRDNAHMNKYRYLPQKPTFSNPDGLSVGFVLDNYKGQNYVGLTCAACHTGQVNYKGTAIRIDGGPAGADMESFMEDIGRALTLTMHDGVKRARFIKAVLARGHYRNESDIVADLDKYAQRVSTYAVINHPTTPYRYGRLDAFGRIYNRVLEHVMSAEQLRDILARTLPLDDVDRVMKGVQNVISADDRDHILERIRPFLSVKQQLRLGQAIYNPPNAPVSYPFLWDIPQHDYVQWNGLAANAGVGPIGRNAGEVIGVFGTLDWRSQRHSTLSTLIGGQDSSEATVNFESSINVRNLRRIERHLQKLKSPRWPQKILGPIDAERAQRGDRLFAKYCVSCHDEMDRDSADRRVIAQMTGVDIVKTDPKMANNSVAYSGYSGILRNLYVDTSVGEIMLQRTAPVAALLTKADINVVATPDPDKWRVQAWLERLYDFASAFFDNEIKPSIKQGQYTPDTTVEPFASLQAYKARPLNGIWATAPYLHNGSVPTLDDLLLPVRREGDPKDGEYRPQTFKVGSREFDPIKVGFRTDLGDLFETRFLGNTNVGHEYAARPTPQKDGTVLPALTREERQDLLEYLKTL
ncbi:MAG: di-heme-cytochrome C peroxidase [Leptothrix ochracea]|uniref:di-heme-cytochrome C peroxidase n=1 Tax=Leptothrix ochracea TaxID=735331 RepID=UPI0034E1BBDC